MYVYCASQIDKKKAGSWTSEDDIAGCEGNLRMEIKGKVTGE